MSRLIYQTLLEYISACVASHNISFTNIFKSQGHLACLVCCFTQQLWSCRDGMQKQNLLFGKSIFCLRFPMEPHPKQNGLKHFSSHPRSTKRRKSFQSMLKNVSILLLTWLQLLFYAAHINRLTGQKIISQSKQHPTRFNLCPNKG